MRLKKKTSGGKCEQNAGVVLGGTFFHRQGSKSRGDCHWQHMGDPKCFKAFFFAKIRILTFPGSRLNHTQFWDPDRSSGNDSRSKKHNPLHPPTPHSYHRGSTSPCGRAGRSVESRHPRGVVGPPPMLHLLTSCWKKNSCACDQTYGFSNVVFQD